MSEQLAEVQQKHCTRDKKRGDKDILYQIIRGGELMRKIILGILQVASLLALASCSI